MVPSVPVALGNSRLGASGFENLCRQGLDSSLGGADRAAVDDYLGSVREIERRVQMASTADTSALEIPDAPIGVPNDIVEHMKLMFDLMGLAFQADLTRVITLSLDKEASMRSYQNLGISEAFHPLSHHGNIADKQEKLTQIYQQFQQ